MTKQFEQLRKGEENDPIDLTIGKVRGAIRNLGKDEDPKVQRALSLFRLVTEYLDRVNPIRI